ncbi:MAG: hypothetical protein KAR81_00875, partial [Sulfurimonas sp.]|nr:hypothetical protein [Sulfurimonas sp.]
KAIIYTKLLNKKTLLVVDSYTTVRFLDIQTLKMKQELKVANNHARYSTKVVAFSTTAENFALINPDAKESKLFKTKNKKLIATIDRHQGEVSCVGIDPKDRYMFSCGDDGKTFAFDINNGKLTFTLPIHVDSVNDIAFSDNGQWVATASYDKNISIFNLSMLIPKSKLKAHSAPVMKLQFLSEHRLFSIDKKGSAAIWDLNTSKVITRLKGIHDDVTQVTVGSDDKFLFLGTKLGYILVYDLHSYALISKKFIKLKHVITSLNFNEVNQELIVGNDSGELLFYNIFENEDTLKRYLEQKDYFLMQKYINENPLLEYTKASEIFTALWERTLQKAKEYLGRNDTAKAVALFKNFKSIPAKKQIMDRLIEEYKEFEKFLMYVNQNKTALAYSLTNKHPVYRETKVFQTMELEWKKSFALAQKYLLNPKSSDKAVEVLAPYRGISEKTKLIQDLLLNDKLYRRFEVAIGQKNFKLSFELIKQHPFLKEYKEYESLIKYSDSLYIKSQILLDKGDTHSAIKLLRVLLDFEDFKEEAKSIIVDIENRQKFFNIIQDGNLLLAYNLLDNSADLRDSEDGKRLQQLWENDLNIANAHAANGDIDGIKSVLEKYMKINSKTVAIATVLSSCYITQLEKSIKDKKTIEKGIKNYILYYGVTEQLTSFFETFKEKYPDTKLNPYSQTQGSINSWRPSMIVKSILD